MGRVLALAAAALAVAALVAGSAQAAPGLRVGVTDRSRLIRGASRGLAWLFSRRLLVVLGQHSLHVFSWHILVYYALAIVVPPLDLSAASRSIILVAAVASLWIAAFGHAWLQDREKTRARLASAG